MLAPDTPISALPAAVRRHAERFASIGIGTVRDLLLWLPFRYEELGAASSLAAVRDGELVTFTAQVTRLGNRRSFRRRMQMTEALLSDGVSEIGAVWFNQPYLVKTIKTGKAYRFTGKAQTSRFGRKLVNPQFEAATSMVPAAAASKVGAQRTLVPVYPLTTGLTQYAIRKAVAAIAPAIDAMEDPVPQRIREAYGLPELGASLRAAHFPTSFTEAENGRARLAFDELFALQLSLGRMRAHRERAKATPIPFAEEVVREFVASFPFAFTADQKRATWDVLQDLAKPHPMYRLLDGDVGTGKTAVAMVAARNAAAAGRQSAIMAPTEILAQQHFASFARQFAGTGVTVALWTNAYKRSAKDGAMDDAKGKKERDALADAIADGSVAVVIGTHALIEDTLAFHDLGLAVVDEQHRFGVRTRQRLVGKSGHPSVEPHLLSMTATPIPRSLALTVYGDLDLSLLKEKPAHRKGIETKVVASSARATTFTFVREQLRAGRQAFVVAPLIEKSDMVEAASIEELEQRLCMRDLKGCSIGVVHGRLAATEKERRMAAFAAGETQVLLATSVVEVGVDVPNATVMCIEGAERFGLAQLHQFRGRIGRGEHASYCFLLPTSDEDAGKRRLKALEKHADGFALAEQDLELRGPGDLLGNSQSGFPEMRFASLGDLTLVRNAREAAQKLLAEDPELASHAPLAARVRAAVVGAHLE